MLIEHGSIYWVDITNLHDAHYLTLLGWDLMSSLTWAKTEWISYVIVMFVWIKNSVLINESIWHLQVTPFSVAWCALVCWKRDAWSSITCSAWRLKTFWSVACRPKFSNWVWLNRFTTLAFSSASVTSGIHSCAKSISSFLNELLNTSPSWRFSSLTMF